MGARRAGGRPTPRARRAPRRVPYPARLWVRLPPTCACPSHPHLRGRSSALRPRRGPGCCGQPPGPAYVFLFLLLGYIIWSGMHSGQTTSSTQHDHSYILGLGMSSALFFLPWSGAYLQVGVVACALLADGRHVARCKDIAPAGHLQRRRRRGRAGSRAGAASTERSAHRHGKAALAAVAPSAARHLQRWLHRHGTAGAQALVAQRRKEGRGRRLDPER